ncbi:DUF6088 family protein [Cereibacter sphaeroides]|uniref:type IV toxin-antitoxin system AbiEi family antitoxin n=1 Tax=Cereibacter sphaeroides TaxID=1063 RepID=UPI001F3505E9|nr:DUF6088 family protein [Cereibacter sphaeroides]MCE6958832.1 DUF6088 family protein [Cereibacter sphaeroides]MCE6973294.1 DUF6088 family protein [Cereibacter sphaeroides]
MRQVDAVRIFGEWSAKGRDVFALDDLRMLFRNDKPAAFNEGLRRLVSSGVLIRAANGVYVNAFSGIPRIDILERIAAAFRRGEYTYVSLETALSRHGLISQVPIDHLTLMTTGSKAMLRTGWGTIEFTHTARPVLDILASTTNPGGALRLATAKTALRDLRRVGRNLHLVDPGELEEAMQQDGTREVSLPRPEGRGFPVVVSSIEPLPTT